MRAFSRCGTLEASQRRLALLTLWRAAGRSGEVGNVSYERLRYDTFFQCVVLQCMQTKVHKMKLVPLIIGFCRLSCWVLAWVDELILNDKMVYDPDHACWLLPGVQGAQSGTKMSSIVKGMQVAGKEGHLAKYKDFSVSSLPDSPTAAGFRPGACDTLACDLPAEIAVHSTGHELTSLSALWEYLNSRVALVMAGALVLAGWPALPRGELGRGPTPPTMAAVPGLSESAVNNYADLLFNLRPTSPPWLLIGGSLRQLVLDGLAVVVMYYAERFAANEMTPVLNAMRSKFSALSLAGPTPHDTLMNWSQLVKAKFTVDNLHLTGGLDKSGSAQVISSVQQMGSTVGHLHSTIAQLVSVVASLKDELASIRGAVRMAASPTSAAANLAAASTPAPIAPPIAPPAADPAADLPAADPPAAAYPPAGLAPPTSFGSLGGATLGAPLPPYDCSGVLARNLFLDMMLQGHSEIKACCLSSNPNLNQPLPRAQP